MVAIVQLVFGIFSSLALEEDAMYITIGLSAFIALIFAALGFWCKKKPFAAIITALVIYGSLLLLDAFLDPTTIIKGIIVKAIIIIYLIKGITAAREAERIKAMMEGR